MTSILNHTRYQVADFKMAHMQMQPATNNPVLVNLNPGAQTQAVHNQNLSYLRNMFIITSIYFPIMAKSKF